MKRRDTMIDVEKVNCSLLKFQKPERKVVSGNSFMCSRLMYTDSDGKDANLLVNLGVHNIAFYKSDPSININVPKVSYKLRLSIKGPEVEMFLRSYINFYVNSLNAFRNSFAGFTLDNTTKVPYDEWHRRDRDLPLTIENFDKKNELKIGLVTNAETGEKILFFDVELDKPESWQNTQFFVPGPNKTWRSAVGRNFLRHEFDANIILSPYDVFINKNSFKLRMMVKSVIVHGNLRSMSSSFIPLLPGIEMSEDQLAQFENFQKNLGDDEDNNSSINGPDSAHSEPMTSTSIVSKFPSAQTQPNVTQSSYNNQYPNTPVGNTGNMKQFPGANNSQQFPNSNPPAVSQTSQNGAFMPNFNEVTANTPVAPFGINVPPNTFNVYNQ